MSKCIDCGCDFEQKRSDYNRCSGCQSVESAKKARLRNVRYRESKGSVSIGSEVSCKNCGVTFVKSATTEHYCCECKKLNASGSTKCRREYMKKYHAKKKEGHVFVMTYRVRNIINQSLRRFYYGKNSRSQEILGCSWEFFKCYIESKFTDGMSWENRSEWELDHIIPVSSAKDEQEMLRLNHYTNFQPLWMLDNRKKSNRLDWSNHANSNHR